MFVSRNVNWVYQIAKMSFDDGEIRKYCHRLPKVELHAHLNGSLSNNTLKQLAEDWMKDLR